VPNRTARRAVGDARNIATRRHRRAVLTSIRLIHTIAWFSIESCMAYLLWAGFTRRSDRRAAIAAGMVAGETAIFAANGFRCPLTEIAERFGARRGAVADIYLPRWFARNLPAIHVPLIVLAGYLHGRQLQRLVRNRWNTADSCRNTWISLGPDRARCGSRSHDTATARTSASERGTQ
jgi:hypothetical protein